ncbi:MAG: hypothetical protein ACREEM_40665 [Blastocatellia bacterium]
MSKLTRKIKEELAEMLPPTIFFFVALHIVAFIHALMTKYSGIDLPTSATVTVAALIIAKSVLLADMMPLINRYPEKPLIWNIVWKTTVYFFVAAVVHYLERLYDFWKEAPGFVAANQNMLAELVWPHFWAIQIVLAVLILMYCVMGELSRVVGRDKLRAMFFGPLPAKTV